MTRPFEVSLCYCLPYYFRQILRCGGTVVRGAVRGDRPHNPALVDEVVGAGNIRATVVVGPRIGSHGDASSNKRNRKLDLEPFLDVPHYAQNLGG